MAHGHSHGHHHHVDPDAGDTRVALAVAVNLALTVAQVVGGIFAGSLALIADALHNFSDAMSLIIAFLRPQDRAAPGRPGDDLRLWPRRGRGGAGQLHHADRDRALPAGLRGGLRFFDPQGVTGWLMIAVAGSRWRSTS
jgi:cobalt-zinc-cadmium efflux system protein